MNLFNNGAKSASLLGCGVLLCGAVLAGCGRNDVEVYKVAKEPAQGDSPSAPSGMMPPGHPDTGGSGPKLTWKLPAGWKEVAPGEMRVASFQVAGKDGKQAEVSVVPLPGMAGGNLANVNRWRGQVGLKPVSDEELSKLAEAVEIAGQPGQLYDLAGENPGSGEKSRILAAVQRREGTAWFYKMTGDADVVAAQKPVFTDFLKSLTFEAGAAQTAAQSELPPSHPPIDGAAMAAAGAAPGMSSAAKPQWEVPAGWQETQGGAFLVAKFVISGSDNGQAAVNVSVASGGLLSNVNRWRQQLGLAPIAESELSSQVSSLELPGGKATLVDLTSETANNGQKTRLVAAVVPHGDQTWFYKLMGSEPLVAHEKDGFLKFVQSSKYQ